MKKLLSILLVLTLSASVIFAESTQEETDSYEDVYTEETAENQEEEEKAPFFNGLSTSSLKYKTGKEVSLFTLNALRKIKQTQGVVTYNLKTDTFGFGSYYMAAYYIVLMDKDNRKLLSEAYNNYLNDFENKKLKRNEKKTTDAYGKILLTLNWGSLKASTPNYAVAKANLGYTFYDNSPYFTIQVPASFNQYFLENEAATEESLYLKYAFTKAQMKKLLESISDKELSKLLPNIDNLNYEVDEYSEDSNSDKEEGEKLPPPKKAEVIENKISETAENPETVEDTVSTAE